MTSTGRKAEVINIDQADNRSAVIEHIAEVISAGGIAALPTDTVYGLCCRKDDKTALQKISRLKKQPEDKPFQTLISSIADAEELCGDISPLAAKLMRSYWPGALTVITAAKEGKTEGLRLPADQDICAVIRKAETPLSATSVNIHGREPLNNASDIEKVFGSDIDLIVTNNSSRTERSSTVVKVEGSELNIIREGELKSSALLNTAKKCYLFYSDQKAIRPLLAAVIFAQIENSEDEAGRIILAVPEIASEKHKLPAAADKSLQEMGYSITMPEIKSSCMTDIDSADVIFTFSEESCRKISEAAPWREKDIFEIEIGEEEFPKTPEEGFSIGPGYREDIVRLEKKIWKIHRQMQKK
ncbi:MAG: L-threonylcarbamoyladenylate synthase [Planctomycetota bacterium]|jgi:L-threonylcarbamoyladenylate synthase